MAWRDSRKNRSRLFLFISSIVLGIAALVAIYSFGDNLQRDIDGQAASLIGADLVVSSGKEVSPKMEKMLGSLGDERSEERSFASMVFFPFTGGTRLIQVRALDGSFPYYGELKTVPLSAGKTFRQGKTALVDKTLLLQFNAKVGDPVTIGNVTFIIAGALEQAPGQNGLTATIAPIVYIPLGYLEQTGLMQRGSRVSYKYYYRFNKPDEVEKLVKKLDPQFEGERIDSQTIQSQKRDTGRAFEDLTRFLSLVGFIALLLGCIGVASSIHIYIREKLSTIAILRCMGTTASQAFLIYLVQIAGIGLIGSVLGAALGTVVQQVLPVVLKDLLPVSITSAISWIAILQGIVAGLLVSLLFAMLPLVSIRNISPLNTLRISDTETRGSRDPLKWLVYLLILAFIVGFSYLQLRDWSGAFTFTAAVVAAFLVLSAVASALMWLVRRFFPSGAGYLYRQGLANLFRPNNQTLILMVSIGLGTGFISTLFFVQDTLVNSVSLSAGGQKPNMILFDIQTTQAKQVADLARKHRLPILQEVPIVTVRVEEINGKTAAAVKKDNEKRKKQPGKPEQLPPGAISLRAFNGELRATYRDSVTNTEKIIEGKWHGTVAKDGIIYVSLDERYARSIRARIGDKFVYNVQGALIPTVVGSIRKVDWNRVQTNFRLVFPKGVLEDAPQFRVLVTRVPSNEASAKFQKDLVSRFPTISVIDLGLILNVLDEIVDKIGFVIRFMAGFSIVTGLIVLIASVLISKYQRIRESVLLRTLGATRRQILAITALEYFFLGSFAAGTGILLSFAGSWALAAYLFETALVIKPLPVIFIFVSISALTVLIGLFNSREVVNRAPLEVLNA
ncbi:FtsX-like permease family protein [Pedobacter sp. HMF7056]|uniref:FtsX-like permease family protein n=2 Tax=Hufsiella ginkgonis TaxID=2695274 RepID=A0A7K1XWR2_9SPHI|nr:FtsX-like permease family protein [Hufsiella ginkgonis]